jgi:hypothetical protein
MRNVMYRCCHFQFTTLHFTSFHIHSLHFASLHFTFSEWFLPQLHLTLFITFLALFLKLLGLQETVPKASAGNWFQRCMVLFTKEYLPISVRCFLLLIFLPRWDIVYNERSLKRFLCLIIRWWHDWAKSKTNRLTNVIIEFFNVL